jgi:hypothetical protein
MSLLPRSLHVLLPLTLFESCSRLQFAVSSKRKRAEVDYTEVDSDDEDPHAHERRELIAELDAISTSTMSSLRS